jgi:hypothetical protein
VCVVASWKRKSLVLSLFVLCLVGKRDLTGEEKIEERERESEFTASEMQKVLRKKVSLKKKRWVKDGFDLDLACTPPPPPLCPERPRDRLSPLDVFRGCVLLAYCLHLHPQNLHLCHHGFLQRDMCPSQTLATAAYWPW